MFSIFRLLFFISYVIYSLSLNAQSVKATLWRDTLISTVGNTYTNRLTISNSSLQKQEVNLSIKLPNGVQALSTFPDRLTLSAGEIVMIPLKGILNLEPDSPVSPVTITIKALSTSQIQSAHFYIRVKDNDQWPISVFAVDETIVVYTGVETANLPVRLVHNRIIPENFSVDISALPEGIDQHSSPLLIKLSPKLDTTLLVPVKPLRYWAINQPYQLILTIRDSQKKIVGTLIYKLLVATDEKSYINANPINETGGYGASLGISMFDNNQYAKEARIWGTDSIGKTQVDFHIHYLNYGSGNVQQLQNSFVSVRSNRAVVRLGSSFDYHELPLFGRGLKVNINQANRQWTFWAINKNQNWLSQDENIWNGNTLSVRYDQQLKNLAGGSWSVSSSYFTQSDALRAGYLNFASFQYNNPERHSLQLLAGQSVEFAQQNSNQARSNGWAGLVNYSREGTKMSWYLRSYFSTPTYSGLQKGATLIYGQLFWQLSPATILFTRLNHVQYNRAYLNNSAEYQYNRFGSTIAEINITHRKRQFSISLRPYWFHQNDLSNPFSQKAYAYRVAPSIMYRRGNNQYFDLSYDVGLFYNLNSIRPSSGWLSQRLMSTLSVGNFSLWAFWQKGPYYLFDVRSTQLDQLVTTSIIPTVNFSSFNRRLAGSIGINYSYNALSEESRYLLVGRVQYDITPSWSARFLGNGTPYSQRPELAYSIYQLEVTKRFGRSREKHHGQLQLSFFEDTNGNNIKDDDEQWRDSLFVTVNGNTLLTNAKGGITYRNLPLGEYTVSAVSAGRLGDPVLYQEKITVVGAVTKRIALARTFNVRGQLHCKTNTYDNQPYQFGRFTVDVQRGQQTVATTKPLPDGTFGVHLAPGDYTLFIRDYGRQPQTTVKTTSFTLSQTGQYPVFNWTVDGSTRSVEVKRFTQNTR